MINPFMGEDYIPSRLGDSVLKSTFVSMLTGLDPATNANNAVAIQAAMDAAATAGGGTVIVPTGTWVTAPLKLRTRVSLIGLGFGSKLKLANASNAHLLRLFDANTEQVSVEDLWLDANSTGQSAGSWDAVNLENTNYDATRAFPSLGDPNHQLRRVSIVNAKRHGVYVAGSVSQAQLEQVLISDCDGNSIRLDGPDCHLVSCVSRRSGLDGFGIYGNSNRLMNCKSFLSGRIDSANGSGFIVAAVNRADLTHCEAQDNRQHGFSLNTTSTSAMVACRADHNGIGPEPQHSGWNGDGLYAYNVTDSRIDLVSGDRLTTGKTQRWAYNCSTGNDRNIVNIIASNTHADTSKGGNGSFGVNSVGFVRWNGTNAAGAFA